MRVDRAHANFADKFIHLDTFQFDLLMTCVKSKPDLNRSGKNGVIYKNQNEKNGIENCTEFNRNLVKIDTCTYLASGSNVKMTFLNG